MKKLLSLFLACILLLGILPTSVFAADSVEEALPRHSLVLWICVSAGRHRLKMPGV